MGRKKNKPPTSVQDEPTTTNTLGPSDTEAPVALHMQDDGFAFPIGENAEKTAAIYFCRSPICPGYTTRASDLPHPATTCGNILNSEDGRVESGQKHEENAVIERPSPTEPFHLPPDMPAVVNESNVQSEDMPQLEPDVVHAGDSPAAAGEPTPDSVELPSPIEDMKPLPPVLVVDRDDLGRYLFRPTFAPEQILPIVGSCWREPGMSDGHCYEVFASKPGDGMVLCLCHLPPDSRECLVRVQHFLNGDLCPLTRQPDFVATCEASRERLSFVVPILEHPQQIGLMSSLRVMSWLPIPGTYWTEPNEGLVYRVTNVRDEPSLPLDNSVDVRVFYRDRLPSDDTLDVGLFLGVLSYISDPGTLPAWTSEAAWISPDPGNTGEKSGGLASRCDEIATELGVETSHVERLVDGALTTVAAVLTFKGVADSSPAADAVIKLISSEKFIGYFRSLLATFNHGVALDVNKVVEYINKTLEPRIDAIERTIQDTPAFEQMDQMRKSFVDLAKALVDDIEQLKERIDTLETLGLAGVEDDVVDEDDEPPVKAEKPAKKPRIAPETEKERRRKRDRARRARVARQEEQLRMRQLRIPGTGLESLDDDLPTKNPRGRSKGATLAAGARTKVGKKRGRGRPKGAKNKPKPVVSDMAARASASARPPKNGAKPLGGGSKASNSFNWSKTIKTPQIVSLLQKIPPSQVDKFREQAKKRLPDLRLTPWSSNEQGRFAQWYFNNPGALA